MNARVLGQDKKIPIRNIFCIGRNYAAHAKELNHQVPDEPVVFLKPVSSIVYHRQQIVIPPQSQEVHYEVELLILICKTAKNVTEAEALNFVAGYGVGIDVTARDIQRAAIKEGKPWTLAKGFDTFAAISDFVPSSQVEDPQATSFSLFINDVSRQNGNTRDMIFSIPELVSYLSTKFTLNEGDIIFTGTPEGVGPLSAGDKIKAVLANELVFLELDVVNA